MVDMRKSNPISEVSVAAFGASMVVLVLGVRALIRVIAESDLPLVGGSS